MLEIRNLEKSFGKKQVLFGIDLTAKKGSILGLIGKNGAGKTTIFHSILRFLEYSGDIQLDGKAISQETYKEIGYLPEERSLMPISKECQLLRSRRNFRSGWKNSK